MARAPINSLGGPVDKSYKIREHLCRLNEQWRGKRDILPSGARQKIFEVFVLFALNLYYLRMPFCTIQEMRPATLLVSIDRTVLQMEKGTGFCAFAFCVQFCVFTSAATLSFRESILFSPLFCYHSTQK